MVCTVAELRILVPLNVPKLAIIPEILANSAALILRLPYGPNMKALEASL